MKEPREIALLAAQAMDEKMAQDLMLLSVGHLTVIADYLLIGSGRSVPQVKTLVEFVEEKLEKEGIPARRKEGAQEGRWAVLDYGSVIVHVFHEQERAYYGLERLWADGTNAVDLQEAGIEVPAPASPEPNGAV